MSATKSTKGPDTRNPSLKKYFKYMVNSRKLTIQFTQGKIREIIQFDLKIDFNNFSELLKDVSVEAFAYYIQGWPGWQPENFQECIDKTEESYKKFKYYLRDKIVKLQEKEKEYVKVDENAPQLAVVGHSIFPPEEAGKQLALTGTAYKIKYPYTLQVSGRPHLLSLMSFERAAGEAILCLRPNERPMRETLTYRETLNHPFVSVQLKLPLLLKLTRRSSPRVEMFLCSISDIWKFPQHERIVDIRNFPTRTNIYTGKFLQVFFNKLVTVIGSYADQISEEKKNEISSVCAEFLSDIYEANLNFSTIQECTEVCYNIGNSVYYSDSARESGERINLRKVYYPQVLYCLVYCSVMQNDIRPDGTLRYFDFHEQRVAAPAAPLSDCETAFVRNVNCSLHYSCTACSKHFEQLVQLQKHLLELHACEETLACTRCNTRAPLYDLLSTRWAHRCPSPADGSPPRSC